MRSEITALLSKIPKDNVRYVCRRCGWCCLAQSLFLKYKGRSIINKDTMVCKFLKFEHIREKIVAKCEIRNDPKRPKKCKQFYCQDCVEIFHHGGWIPLMKLTKGIIPIYPNISFYPKFPVGDWTDRRDRLMLGEGVGERG